MGYVSKCFDMVFFCTGGMTMRKPYATSSNYVLKMSSYKYSKEIKIGQKNGMIFILIL